MQRASSKPHHNKPHTRRTALNRRKTTTATASRRITRSFTSSNNNNSLDTATNNNMSNEYSLTNPPPELQASIDDFIENTHQQAKYHAKLHSQQLRPATHITKNLLTARRQLAQAALEFQRPPEFVSLLAVSKTHPPEAILEAYHNTLQRSFGENYVAELCEKAAQLPQDIRWHFIGHLQSNKAKFLARIPNLHVVETIDSPKLASKLNAEIQKVDKHRKLRVLVQVNTSLEPQKSGTTSDEELLALVEHIISVCPGLKFSGLMTIGKRSDEPDASSAPFFEELARCRSVLIRAFPRLEEDVVGQPLMMSMGMSDDYKDAVKCGTTQIRVGTAIFGSRTYAPKDAPAESSASGQQQEKQQQKQQEQKQQADAKK